MLLQGKLWNRILNFLWQAEMLITNVAHVGSINFCAYKSVENTERAEGLSKTEFKNLHLLLQENPFLFLMESSTNKSME